MAYRFPRIVPALLLAASSQSFAANYATCILEKLPGAEHDVAAYNINGLCRQQFPGRHTIVKGSGKGSLFAPKDVEACIASHTKNTPSPQAGRAIAAACDCLYGSAPPMYCYGPSGRR